MIGAGVAEEGATISPTSAPIAHTRRYRGRPAHAWSACADIARLGPVRRSEKAKTPANGPVAKRRGRVLPLVRFRPEPVARERLCRGRCALFLTLANVLHRLVHDSVELLVRRACHLEMTLNATRYAFPVFQAGTARGRIRFDARSDNHDV